LSATGPFANPSRGGPAPGDSFSEERSLLEDPRLQQSIELFNSGEWHACHDGFEELWHETQGPLRPVLQGILQIAVAHLHLERGNTRGATVLLGEGLGRLAPCGTEALGCNLQLLCQCARIRLEALQRQQPMDTIPLPRLVPLGPPPASVD
jgi:predicted metal-dependent hydrolase